MIDCEVPGIGCRVPGFRSYKITGGGSLRTSVTPDARCVSKGNLTQSAESQLCLIFRFDVSVITNRRFRILPCTEATT